VLAAGKSHQLDGEIKVLIRHPHSGRTILDHLIDAFGAARLTVVVGFRAIQVMQAYPQLRYVHSPEWALTNNAMSLSLALDDEPCYVVSGDIFLERSLVDRLDRAAPDLILTSDREKRSKTAIHCVVDERQRITETYQGPVRSMSHPEAIGLFKVTSPEMLHGWRRRCREHSNLFAGQLLPTELGEIASVPIERDVFFEVNTPEDYLELMRGGGVP
jgi:choline kinase